MFRTEQDSRDDATRGPNGGEVSADLLAASVATGPTADRPSDAVALVGYLGAAGSDDYRRLYRHQAVEMYIEIRGNDIVDHSPAAGDGDPMAAQSVIWVRRDARVVWHESMRASTFETPPGARYEWPRP